MQKNNLNILIAGGGIAGPCLAFWLNRTGANVTIVERSPKPRPTGQGIDIRGPAVTVVDNMGLLKAVKDHGTHEKGIRKIGASGNVLATFGATGDVKSQSFTSEFEILRGDLAKIFTEAVQGKVKVVYDDYISALDNMDNGIQVSFANGRLPTANYDLVVGADGLSSKTREIAMKRSRREDIVPFDGYVAYFSLPVSSDDSNEYADFYSADLGRSIVLRPSRDSETLQAVLCMGRPKDNRILESVELGDVQRQKQLVTEYFTDAGWKAERVLKEMNAASDFYVQELAQVRMKEGWVHGRVVFLGDAAWSPSGLTGMGTSSAIYGAYCLAGEIGKLPDDIPTALKNWETFLKPYIQKIQKTVPGAPSIALPQTKTGVSILNGVAAVIDTLKLQKLGQYMPSLSKGESQALPPFAWP